MRAIMRQGIFVALLLEMVLMVHCAGGTLTPSIPAQEMPATKSPIAVPQLKTLSTPMSKVEIAPTDTLPTVPAVATKNLSPDLVRAALARDGGLGWLLFTRFEEGHNTIYVSRPDGSSQVVLGTGIGPTWSPDHRHISYYISNNENLDMAPGLYLMNADGSRKFRLANAGGYSWSPDSTRIVFAEEHHQGNDIYMINVDGSHPTRVAYDGGFPKLSWSPNGKSILVSSLLAGLYMMSPNGSQSIISLANSDGFDWSACCGSPWSPDSMRIAIKKRDGAIYLMAPDGSHQTRLTDGDDYEPKWSPDGKLIGFVRLTIGNDLHLYVMNADGSHQVDIGDGNEFAWAPDGKSIACTFYEDGKEAIKILNLDTYARVVISNAWSPDW